MTIESTKLVASQLDLLLRDAPFDLVHKLNLDLQALGVPFSVVPNDQLGNPKDGLPLVGNNNPPLPNPIEAPHSLRSPTVALERTPEESSAPPDWTPSQKAALEKIQAWLQFIADRQWEKLEGRRYFVLRGYAGTGKSFLTRYLYDVSPVRSSMEFCAPTHRATTVLSGYLGRPARTLASRLGVKAVYDEDDVTFQLPDKPPYIPSGSVIVLDESSMISKEYLQFLKQIADQLNLFILFIGDPAQLPPVGERSSKVWKVVSDDRNKHTLTDIRRVNDNAIVDLHVALREQIFSKERLYINPIPEIANGETVVLAGSQRKFVRYIRDSAEAFRAGEAKVIAWRNKTVDHYTEVVRGALGFGAEMEIGERLTLSGSFIPFGKGVGVEEVGQNTEEVEVIGIHQSILTPQCELLPDLDSDIPVTVLELSGESFEASSVAVPKSHEHLNHVLSMIAAQARGANKDRYRQKRLWDFFWETKRRFIRPRSAYTATSHSFQGSQCAQVFCDTQDILANPTKSEAFRCLYVAASRCTERIISN